MQKDKFCYFDHNATSMMPKIVQKQFHEWLGDMHTWGNASSTHQAGQKAARFLRTARAQIANMLGVPDYCVFFTSGATEANNWALWQFAQKKGKKRILCPIFEHPSILNYCRHLEKSFDDVDIEWINITSDGIVDLSHVERVLSDHDAQVNHSYDHQLMICMYANNETGIIQPIDDLCVRLRAHQCMLHIDAVQALGKVSPTSWLLHPTETVSFAAHKIGGLTGVGLLVMRDANNAQSMIHGGAQEARRRAGTENIVGVASMLFAMRHFLKDNDNHLQTFKQNRAIIKEGVERIFPNVVIFGKNQPCLPNTLCFALPAFLSETLLMFLDMHGICVGSGSACSSGKVSGSHVIEAMGYPELANKTIRISLGLDNTEDEAKYVVSVLENFAKINGV